MQYPVAHPLQTPIKAAMNAGMSKSGFILDERKSASATTSGGG